MHEESLSIIFYMNMIIFTKIGWNQPVLALQYKQISLYCKMTASYVKQFKSTLPKKES